MPEAVMDQIEQRILQKEQNIRELEKQVSILTEIPYILGFENKAATVPIMENLKDHPVSLAFSWGPEAPNMSVINLGKNETSKGNQKNVDKFLEEHIGPSQRVINIIGKFEGVQQQIEEVDVNYVNPDPNEDPSEIKANFVIIRDEVVAGTIKPADCPIVVIYAKDRDGNPLVVIDHCGREALNAGMTRQGAWYLEEKYGVDLSKAVVGILPGMARKNYFITDDMERWGNSILERNWGPWIDERVDDTSRDEQLKIERNDAGIQKRHVDMTRAAIMQLLQAGVDPKNIQAIDVDSFEAAQNGESFSHRQSMEVKDENGNPKRLGRFMLAVKLNPQVSEMPKPQEEGEELLAA